MTLIGSHYWAHAAAAQRTTTAKATTARKLATARGAHGAAALAAAPRRRRRRAARRHCKRRRDGGAQGHRGALPVLPPLGRHPIAKLCVSTTQVATPNGHCAWRVTSLNANARCPCKLPTRATNRSINCPSPPTAALALQFCITARAAHCGDSRKRAYAATQH